MSEGAFGGAAGRGAHAAVLVVDLSVGFTDPASPLGADLTDVVTATRRLLDAAREAGAPVIFTTVAYDAAGETAAAVFLRKVPALRALRPGSRWVEIDERLGRREDEALLVKPFASAFFATPLAPMLAAAGTGALLVAGATTSGCVRASMVDAMQHAVPAAIVRECVGDRSESAHRQALLDVEGRYGDVIGLDEALASLGGRPGAGAVQEAGQVAPQRT